MILGFGVLLLMFFMLLRGVKHSGQEWTEHVSPDGRKFWYHAASGTSSWTDPQSTSSGFENRNSSMSMQQMGVGQQYSAQSSLQYSSSAPETVPLWKEYTNHDGRKYYISRLTGESVWDRPGDFGSVFS